MFDYPSSTDVAGEVAGANDAEIPSHQANRRSWREARIRFAVGIAARSFCGARHSVCRTRAAASHREPTCASRVFCPGSTRGGHRDLLRLLRIR